MNRETLFTIGKGIIIILIIMAIVFALKAPAADLNGLDADGKALYTDASGLPYFSEMDSYYNYRLT
ncbi:STT3 domain-containing protein, partial [uncultured Methanobrevibacter sp.]